MADNPFQRAEQEYYGLRGRLAAGRITQEQFEQSVRELMLQDAQGRYWVLGVESGKWHVYNGSDWVPSDPPSSAASTPPTPPPAPQTSVPPYAATGMVPPPAAPQPPPVQYIPPPPAQYAYAPPPATPMYAYPPPAPAQKGGLGCGRCLLLSCLAVFLLACLLGVGGFVAYQSGALTMNTVLNLVGMGPATIEVDNFRDDAILVDISAIDTEQGTSSFPNQLQLNAFDIKSFRSQNPAKFRVDFRTKTNTKLGTCTLNLRGGDHFQFVALPERIAINRANSPSSVGSDFVIQTSSFCR